MITCVGCGNAIISPHAVQLRAPRMTLHLMDTAIKHIFMIVMWQSITMSQVSYVPIGSHYIHFTLIEL